jgi:hypothetical protein
MVYIALMFHGDHDMKYLTTGLGLILLGAFVTPSLAQPQSMRHAVFAEAGGSAVLYSANYDIRFHDRFSLRAGYAYFEIPTPLWADSPNRPVPLHMVPIVANVLWGEGAHLLETGTGPVLAIGKKDWLHDQDYRTARDGQALLWTVTVAYRYQPARGVFFRAGFTPLLGPVDQTLAAGESRDSPGGFIVRMLPMPGLSLGYTF